MSEEVKPFLWAHDDKANIQEPIDALKQQGWRYGDVPAASNFNWMFKKISDDLVSINKELLVQKTEVEKSQALILSLKDELSVLDSSVAETREGLISANDELLAHKHDIAHNGKEIDTTNKNHELLKDKTKKDFQKTFRNDDFNTGVSRQICMLLRAMEDMLQYYHPGFPKQPWPLQEHASVDINENDATSSPT
jgi:hypothetical protein